MIPSATDSARPLADCLARERFGREVDRNFLVIAPAGVGKTTAIVARIGHMASLPNAEELLSTLIVITYTRKAAAELRQRVMDRVRKFADVNAMRALESAFFGTIDSFLVRLLEEFGTRVGYRRKTRIIEMDSPEEAVLWHDFLDASRSDWAEFLPPAPLKRLLQLADWEELVNTARRINPNSRAVLPDSLPPLPMIHWEAILSDDLPTAKASQAVVLTQRKIIGHWRENFERGNYAPIRLKEKWSGASIGDRTFADICHDHWLAPLARWVEVVGGVFCHKMAEAYQQFRLKNFAATYDDMRLAARKLLCYGDIVNCLRNRNYRVLLDEAQDTTADDFEFFLQIVPQDPAQSGPRQGYFSLVGDGQQSIYLADGEELRRFGDICDRLKSNHSAEELVFNVTMRCPETVVSAVNRLFPKILDGCRGQARFVPMVAAERQFPGQVLHVALRTAAQSATLADEMEEFASFLAAKTPEDLGVWRWSDVAILSGINRRSLWELRRIFGEHGIPAECKVRNRTWGDFFIYRWMCGLTRVLTAPADLREIVCVLREVFGISDEAIAMHVCAYDSPVEALMHNSESDGENLIGSILRDMRSVSISNEAVSTIFQNLNTRFQLLEKIRNCVPPAAFSQELIVWEKILGLAHQSDGHGIPFQKFVPNFFRQFFATCEISSPPVDGVQIDNFHGSKGLQWPVVILPFLNRKISTRPMVLPHFAYRDGQPLWLVVAGTDEYQHVRANRDLGKLQNFERLLYVAMTRAQQTLILVSVMPPTASGGEAEEETHASGEQNAAEYSPQSLLDLDPQKFAQFFPGRIPFFEPQPEPLAFANENEFPAEDFSTVCRRAREVLASIPPADAAGEPNFADGSGQVVYGNWWHEAMRHFPWHADEDERRGYLDYQIARSPDEARGRQESDLFLRSRLYEFLCRKFAHFYSEWEFYDGNNGSGIIDLLCVSRCAREICVVDWKTDRGISAEQMEKYRCQVRRYVNFVLNGSGENNVRGVIYHTPTGEDRIVTNATARPRVCERDNKMS
ncbi:MAG: UvrD-helicase domain-containing protein [Puniceicoccales bacterium]|jgi:ATP-dependent exoDNAse (exonuclease V) beta subunit|nr:UvrD-helicase domain-containing protein [Puniceicoccales bacterium]